MHVGTQMVPVKFSKLIQKLDRRSGKVLQEDPTMIKNGDAALVELTPMKPLVVEKYSDYDSLARFVILDMKQTVMVGVVKDVEKCET